MGKGLEKTLLKRGFTSGQYTDVKILNITNHQGNANQKTEISPHTSE